MKMLFSRGDKEEKKGGGYDKSDGSFMFFFSSSSSLSVSKKESFAKIVLQMKIATEREKISRSEQKF